MASHSMPSGNHNLKGNTKSGGSTDYTKPFAVVTSLFFMWAIALNLNDILIPHLKKACNLSDFQSSLIQTAYFGGYFVAALPAGWFMRRYGYKAGIIAGLLLCALGAFLFYPAAETRMYGFFLTALFIMACGAASLEVAANPYVTVLGPSEKGTQRLNLAQSFNALGAVITPQIGKIFILTGIEYSAAQLSAMNAGQLEVYRSSEAGMVQFPYLVLGGIFVLIALVVFLVRLPEIVEAGSGSTSEPSASFLSLFAIKQLRLGVLAQFLYVGAQVGVVSFIIRFGQVVAGLPERSGADMLTLHLVVFLVGRFVGTLLNKYISGGRLLVYFGLGALLMAVGSIFTSGMVSVWAVVAIGFFHSIMFPTIFALSIKDLGPQTKMASSLIIMAIVGGALVPPIMGYISDIQGIHWAFMVPVVCYLYIIWYGKVSE